MLQTQHAAGQTFVWRPELSPGTGTYRYALYRSNAGAITSLTGLTPIQTFLPYNGAQVFGGKPDAAGGEAFTTANRLDPTAQGCKLPDGTQLGYGVALAVHTCAATEMAWYALAATDASGNVAEAVQPGLNASTAPTAETALATPYPRPVVWGDGSSSGTRGTAVTRLTGTPGLPCLLRLHASSAAGGAPANNVDGDYLQFFGDDDCGYQGGLQTAWDVLEYQSPSPHQLWASTRETMWRTDLSGAYESWHMGAAFLKSGWPSPRFKMWQHRRLLALLDYLLGHYQADPAALAICGQSMGSWGTAAFAYRYPQYFCSIQGTFTNFRVYTRPANAWPVVAKGTPFGAPAFAVGTDPAAVTLDDGVTPWGGDGGYTDAVTLIANATADLPMGFHFLGRQDGYSNMTQFFQGLDALEASRQPYAAYWTNGGHSPVAVGIENVLLDSGGTTPSAGAGRAQPWATYWGFAAKQFRRDKSYPAFSNASHNDLETDAVGGRNVGFRWGTDPGATNGAVTDAAGGWSAYLDNVYMDVTPAAGWNSSTGALNFGGPQRGPFAQITADVTPVFRQGFLPAPGASVHYTFTPSGGGPVSGTVAVPANGRFTIPAVAVSAGGPTLLSLS